MEAELGNDPNRWHNRESVTSRMRLRGHDYSTSGIYFITVCTNDRACLFGGIHNGDMVQSHAGVMIESWWHSIPWAFPGMALDAMVVMPNHIHGLVLLGVDPDLQSSVQLSDVVSWFKSRTTHDYILGVKTEGWSRFPGRLWQTGYYDHIVRTESSLGRIRDYIARNPSAWSDDENFIEQP